MNAVKCPCCREWAYEEEIIDKRCFKCAEDPQVDMLSASIYSDWLDEQDGRYEDLSWILDEEEDLIAEMDFYGDDGEWIDHYLGGW